VAAISAAAAGVAISEELRSQQGHDPVQESLSCRSAQFAC
jgi:hypothetical protein